jgi:phospholipase/lecithinase/hemolysin
MIRLRRFALLPSLILLLSSPAISRAQHYTSIVVFGDSLSDTGNDARLSYNAFFQYFPGPVFDYTVGRFTDGYDTVPAAINYKGVWVEQLAAMLPSQPTVAASLDGGKDYAYGFGFTGGGTTLFTIEGPYAITVDNVDLQITHYLATHPRIDDKTLFIVWAGANDVLNATSSSEIVNAGINQAADVERLVAAGATQFIVPNLPPLGAIPRLNTLGPVATAATEATVLYNDTLATGLKIVHDFNFGRHLRIYPMDVFTLVNKIIASPSSYQLVNVTSSSQGNFTVNPDTYLFWDGLHPTTHGHHIVAVTADEMIKHNQCLADARQPAIFAGNHNDEGADADSKCVLADGDADPRK